LDRGWLVWGLLILLLLLGAALRLYQLDGKGLWYDELGTALYTAPEKPLRGVVRGPLEVPVIPAPPLYFLTTYLFRQVSEIESLLRVPSVFYGLLTIAAIYVLGRAVLGPWEGLVGAFLLTISAFHIRYSQEARYYSLLMLLATLSLYFFYRGLRRNDRLSWVGYVVSSTLAIYTHLFAFLFVAVEGIYAAIYFARRRLRGRPSGDEQGSRSWWRGESFSSFLLSVLVVGLLYLPMLPYTLGGLLSRKGLGGHVPTTISRTSLSYLAGIVDLFGAGPGLPLFCYLLALGLGLYFMARRSRQQLVLAALWIILPFLVVFLVPAGHNFRLRYVIFVLPVFLLVVSAGLVGLSQLISTCIGKRVRKERLGRLLQPMVLTIGCALFGVFSLGALQRYWAEEKQPWDKAAAFLQSVVGPGEVVVTTNEAHTERLLYYGYDASEVAYLVPCPCPAPAKMEDWYRFLELASPYQQAWLLDPNPKYRRLRPGGQLAQELESYVLLPPIVFKGHTRSSVVEMDLLAPFMTSDMGVLAALPADPQPTDEQIIELGSLLVSQAEELYPGGTRSQFTMGELYRFYGSEDDAIAHYEAGIADDPRFYPAYEGLALIHIRRGELGRAVELYRTLSEMGVIDQSYYHFLLGSKHMVEGDLGAAIGELAVAVSMDADDLPYRLRLGDAYLAAGRLDEAMVQYNEILTLDPSSSVAHSRRGKIYRAQGRLAEAVGEYQIAVQLRPDNPFYHAMVADTYRHQGLLDEALAEAKEAVRLGEDEAAYHVLLGEVYEALDLLPQAIGQFEEGVLLAPSVAPYYLDLGDAYRLAGRDEDAIAAYERVLELDPGNATATSWLRQLR
jgi:tetratricopeptide (TPR) repeat protein/4-amino-4-deoxy-L-arabinose transferase-like glycosyltransferase